MAAILIGFSARLRRVLVSLVLLWCYPCWASFTTIQGWVKASGTNTCTTNVVPTGAGHLGIFCITNLSDSNFFSSVSGGGSWTVATGSLADDTARQEFTECAYNLSLSANATAITGNVTGNASGSECAFLELSYTGSSVVFDNASHMMDAVCTSCATPAINLSTNNNYVFIQSGMGNDPTSMDQGYTGAFDTNSSGFAYKLNQTSVGSPPHWTQFYNTTFAAGAMWLYEGTPPPPPSTGDFTIAVLPDTQFYSEAYPQLFDAQTQWITNNISALNIQMVLGEGDVVNNTTTTEFQNASAAVQVLDNAKTPYLLAVGNHDYDNNSPSARTSGTGGFNTYFGPSRYSSYPWYGGQYPSASNENFYGTLTIGGKEYLFLLLELYPRDSSLAWAKSVIQAHPNDEVIVVTHAFEFLDNTRTGACDSLGSASFGLGSDNDGEKLWDNFIKQFSNISLVLSGHFIDGDATGEAVGRRADPSVSGNIVNQVLANYQNVAMGGDGYLRILKFRPSLNTIEVTTYSPYLNAYLTDPNNQFTLQWHGSASTATGSITLSGTVHDASCGTVVGATVSAGGKSAITDSTGSFSMTVPVPGTYTVFANAGSSGSASRTFNAALNYPAYVKLQLTNGTGSISGNVSGGTGPIAGAIVSFNWASTLTDASGNYSLSNVYAGSYSVTAMAAGYAPVTQNVRVSSGGSSAANFSLGSGAAGAIRGKVTDSSANGISGATVSYSGGSANADTNGNYTLANVVPGTYTLTAAAAGYANATQNSTVTAGATTTTNFTLTATPGTITGKVSNSTRTGISGATVSYSGGSASADTNGSYTLANVAPGTYNLTASAAGYANATQSSTVTAGATTTTNFTLTATAFAVSISPTSVSLVAGATQQFTATVTGSTNTSVNWSATAGTISSSGLYTAPSSAGTYTVTATSIADSTKSATATVTVSFSISGTISGTGANGAKVSLGGAVSATVTANSSGGYTFTGLANGSYTVTPSLAGFVFTPASQSVTVAGANLTAVNFSSTAQTVSASFTAIQGWVKASGANTCTIHVAPTGARHLGIFCITNFSDNNIFSSVSGGGTWTMATGSLADDTTRQEFTECAYNPSLSANATAITGNVTGNASSSECAFLELSYTGSSVVFDNASHMMDAAGTSCPTPPINLSTNNNYVFVQSGIGNDPMSIDQGYTGAFDTNSSGFAYKLNQTSVGTAPHWTQFYNTTFAAGAMWLYAVGGSGVGSISGVVTDSLGSAISGATISYSGGSNTSDASGNYTLTNVAPGTYTLTASAAGYANTTQSSTVTAGATTTTDFTLTATAVAVSISPTSVSLPPGATQQLTATVTGSTNTGVNCSASAGTISPGSTPFAAPLSSLK